jgi:hypothetical protein
MEKTHAYFCANRLLQETISCWNQLPSRVLRRIGRIAEDIGRTWLAALLLCLAGSVAAQAATLIATNSLWSYQKGTQEASTPVEAWRALAFDDSTWAVSRAPFYYDTDTVNQYTGNTLLADMNNNYTCIFLRQTFVVAHVASLSDLALTVKCDDGFVMWLNTNEARRFNVSSGPVIFTNTAPTGVAKAVITNLTLVGAEGFLVDGTNLVALQVFNRAKSNRDFFIDLELSARIHETVPPLLIGCNPASGTVTHLTQIGVIFSEPVTGLTADDLLINGQAAASVTGSGDSYTFCFPQPAYGQVTVNWDPGQRITDLASNRFVGDLTLATYTLVDRDPPRVALMNPPPGAAVRQLSQVEVKFTESVAGVDARDLLVNGQPADRLTERAGGTYVFEFTVPATGTVTFAWAPDHRIVDLSQPPNPFAGENWTLTYDPNAVVPSVILNEFLTVSLNPGGLRDEDGELQGWIELFNQGSNAVSLAGWALTDTASAPDRWVFPDVTLLSQRYLIVFASGKDRRPVQGPLHTNFKLNPSGEYLGLFNNESPRRVVNEFAPQYPEQRYDYSYGRDSSATGYTYSIPTPGASNGLGRIEGVVAPIHFSVERGLYRTPFVLHLSTVTADAVIRFTTNGTPPTESTGQIYAQSLSVEHTTTLRAAAFRTNMLPSSSRTHTYIFPDDVLRQSATPPGFPATTMWSQYGIPSDYGMDARIVDDPQYSSMMVPALLALPTVSIVMKTDDMFGEAHGLYTHAGNTEQQAACSIELINPDGSPGFQTDCGIQMHGGGSRFRTMKHPFRLRFKSEYGPAKLDYPFFPDSPVTEFDTIDLRSDYNNHWTHGFDADQRSRGQLIRDAWIKEVQAAMGAFSSHSRDVHLFINGLYWGIYNPCERPNASFAASYFGGKKEDYDAFNGTAPSPPIDGDNVARNTLLGISNLDDPAQYALMQQYLNVPQYIDYLILQWYGANQDWGTTKNWYSFRCRQPDAGFFYMAWDSERILEGVNDYVLWVSADGLHPKLAANPDYRMTFADHIHAHFFNGGALTTNAVIQSWMRRAATLDTAIVAESARWGDSMPKSALSPLPYPTYQAGTPYNRNEDWLGEQGRLLTNYFPYRSDVVLNQLRAAGLYPSLAAPVFHQHGGRVPAGFRLFLSNPGQGGVVLYSTNGMDPRIPVTGAISPDARTYSDASPVTLTMSAIVKARVRDNSGNWSALNEAEFHVAELGLPVRITEIMYNPIGGSTYEFIELQNVGYAPADLSGATFVGIEFVFPHGTVLAPGARLVLIPDLNPAAFLMRYPSVQVFGYYQKNLANQGERLELLDQWGHTITSVAYKNSDPWPTLADGGGRSLELMNLTGSPNDPANWLESASDDGSPGRANPVPIAPMVWINEVMAYNTTAVSNAWGFSDWVEIHNRGSQSVDLAGWSLSSEEGQRKWAFPQDAHLAPGDFLLVWYDAQTNSPGLHAGFALERHGDTLALYDSATHRVDAVTYGPQLPNQSIGRVSTGTGEWQLNQPTPGVANQPVSLVFATHLVINEWMANPQPGSADWLELYNPSDTAPAALMDVYLGTSNALFQIKSIAFVAPQGYVRLWADEQSGGNHLDFKLPAHGGQIDLYDATGQRLDQQIYGPQNQGSSQGRLPDGSGTIVTFTTSASPGAANYLPAYRGPILNEVMANNLGSVHDSAGRVCDWIELYNPADTAFDLGGMSLSEGESKPGQWTFPPGTTLAAQGYLVVWFDETRPASIQCETNLNVGRALPKEQGELYWFDVAGQCVDSIEYGCQIANATIGRTGNQWWLLDHPTPADTNASPAILGPVGQLKINEWMASLSQADDWFELFNADTRPVELSGLILTDDPSIAGQTKFQIGPLSFIDGRGWVKWVADGQAGGGRNHVNFRLDAQGETLRIGTPSGAVIDDIHYGIQEIGVSEGRLPDGSATIARFPKTPTPGAANTLTFPPIILIQPDTQIAGAFRLQITGTAGSGYIILTSTNLVHWTPLVSLETPQGVAEYADTLATNYPACFYRAMEEPSK